MARLFYSGDINANYGGHFYSLNNFHHDYVNLVRITATSDAGGPDNVFWVEKLTVNLRKGAELQRALDVVGVNAETYAKATRATRRHMAIEACLSYGFYDVESSETVSIGEPLGWKQAGDSENVMHQLRGNASIRNYARNIALEYCA